MSQPAATYQLQDEALPMRAAVRLTPLTDANFADFADVLRYRDWREDKPASSEMPLTLAQNMARMTDDPQSGCLIWLIQESQTQQIVGAITLMPVFHIGCRQLGYWLAPQYHGKGYASQAVSQLVRFCFECTSIVRLQAQVLLDNPTSRRVLEKAGFTLEATLGASELKDGTPCASELFGIVKENTK